jgi:hypothetical protein
VIEAAGRASSSLICNGFMTAAVNTSIGLGMPNLPVAGVPGHPGVQSVEQLRENILGVTLDQVIANLTQAPAAVVNEQEPGARDIVFSGGFDAVNRWFTAQELSDGLPVVPPTRARIDAFLRCCDRDPDEVLGIILPDSRAATVWSVAVNGVMAGCRPQYMPLLIALAEAMADPYYGVEHSGNTPGGETLIMLNGPIAAQLGFNCEQGVMRDGIQANTSVGRFWRLYLRNIAGFLPGKNDKATFGNTWRVVVPENEPFVAQIGWQPMSVDMGFNAGDNTVTIARYTGGNHVSSVSGSTPEALMPYIADAVVKQHSWQLMFSVGQGKGTLRPLILLGPIIAETLAQGGWSKADVRQYLYDHARVTAAEFERYLRDWTNKPIWDLTEEARFKRIPQVFHESDDPQRRVPLVWEPDDFMLMVTGDPARNSVYVFAHNGVLGYPTTHPVRLPANWQQHVDDMQKEDSNGGKTKA